MSERSSLSSSGVWGALKNPVAVRQLSGSSSDSAFFFLGRRTASAAFCRVSDALINASSAQQDIMELPPTETKGSVTPVRGSRSVEPNTFSMACTTKIMAAEQAVMT